MGHYYAYKFAIRENRAKKKWKNCFFENDSIKLQFIPYYNKIYIAVTNKVGADAAVLWDSAVFVENNNRSAILLAGSQLHLMGHTPATVVAKDSTYRNYFRSAAFVKYLPNDSLSDAKGWRIFDMYPIYDHKSEQESNSIMGAFGRDMFTLFLPVSFNDTLVRYQLTFFPVELERVDHPSQIPKPSWE